MDRLTERTGSQVAYIGKHTKMPGLDNAGSMRVAAVRDVMERLAEYEDTGLSPEEFATVNKILNNELVETVKRVTADLPQVITRILETLTPDQVIKLMQGTPLREE